MDLEGSELHVRYFTWNHILKRIFDASGTKIVVVKMARFATCILFTMYMIIYRFDLALKCNQPLMQSILEEYHCMGSTNDTFLKNVSYSKMLDCVILCQHLKECYFIHNNVNGRYCLLSSKLCTDLKWNLEYLLYTFKPHHGDCFTWKTIVGNTFQNGIEVQRPTLSSIFVSRIFADGYWYPAKTVGTKCKAAISGEKVSTTECDILQVDELCAPFLSWIFFTKEEGRALPLGAVVGGNHPEGHPLYIAKAIIQKEGGTAVSLGYYGEQNGLGYFVAEDKAQEVADVYILTLLWFIHCIKTTVAMTHKESYLG